MVRLPLTGEESLSIEITTGRPLVIHRSAKSGLLERLGFKEVANHIVNPRITSRLEHTSYPIRRRGDWQTMRLHVTSWWE